MAVAGVFLVGACRELAETSPGKVGNETSEDVAAEDWRSGQEVEVRGVLQFFPQGVKSLQAWLGHEFLVGEVPVKPTKDVSADALRKMVGLKVVVSGTWNAGEEWTPEGEEEFLSSPEFGEDEQPVRGEGVEAKTLRQE